MERIGLSFEGRKGVREKRGQECSVENPNFFFKKDLRYGA